MLYRVAGDPKIGYDLGVGTGTYGGYVRWVRTLVRVRYGVWVRGYGTGVRYGGPVRGYGMGGTVRGYGTVGTVRGYGTEGTVYPPYRFGNSTTFPENRYGGYTVPVRRTPVTVPRTVPLYRTRTRSTYLHTVPVPKSTCPRPVPYPNPLGMYTIPPRDAQIENLDFITPKN